MLEDPRNRLIGRALVVGLLAALASLKAGIGDGLTGEEIVDIVSSFIVAALAIGGVEYTTPLNKLVGVGK